MATGMAHSNVFTNDEVRNRILNVYAKFVSDVEPDRLFDWLVQEHVITIDQKQRMHRENLIASDRCRAILDHLFSIQHPRAFLVVRQALKEDNHYLLETIDNREPGPGIHVQPQEQSVLHAKIQELEKDLMLYRSVNAQILKNKDDLKQQMHQLDSELRSQKYKAQLEKRAWEVERDGLLKKQNEKTRAWEVERDCLVKQQNELETKLHTAKVTIQQLEKDKEDMKRAQEAENSRILQMPKELGTNLHLGNPQNGHDFKTNPVLVQAIKTRASKKGKEINGFTILDKELFVVNSQSSEVEVYDIIKFSFSRRWNLKKVTDLWDIVSCNKNQCLYIIDIKMSCNSNEILRVDRYGQLIKHWSTGNDYGWSLTTTNQSNVILAVFNRHKLNEYSPDGLLVREVILSSDPRMWYPKHAIKLSNGHFLVDHGLIADDLLRVCLVDSDGKRKKSFYVECASSTGQKDYPFHLYVDGNGFVFVADRNNGRVLLLDSDLKVKREILSKEKDKLQGPSRILLDESNGRLIVADNNMMSREGQILFFDFRK